MLGSPIPELIYPGVFPTGLSPVVPAESKPKQLEEPKLYDEHTLKNEPKRHEKPLPMLAGGIVNTPHRGGLSFYHLFSDGAVSVVRLRCAKNDGHCDTIPSIHVLHRQATEEERVLQGHVMQGSPIPKLKATGLNPVVPAESKPTLLEEPTLCDESKLKNEPKLHETPLPMLADGIVNTQLRFRLSTHHGWTNLKMLSTCFLRKVIKWFTESRPTSEKGIVKENMGYEPTYIVISYTVELIGIHERMILHPGADLTELQMTICDALRVTRDAGSNLIVHEEPKPTRIQIYDEPTPKPMLSTECCYLRALHHAKKDDNDTTPISRVSRSTINALGHKAHP